MAAGPPAASRPLRRPHSLKVGPFADAAKRTARQTRRRQAAPGAAVRWIRARRRRTCRNGSGHRCGSRSRTTSGAAPTSRGSTTPGRRARSPRFWMRSSPTAAAASRPSAMSAAVSCSTKPVSTACAAQTPGVAVGLQLEPHRARLRALRVLAPDAPVGAEQVLDVMAVLVGDDVGLGERPAARAEARAQLAVEAEVDVDRLVARAVERADRRGRAPQRGLRLAGEELRRRLAVALDWSPQ